MTTLLEAAQQEPLTDDEIDVLWEKQKINPFKTYATDRRAFARAIEAAHGITGTAPKQAVPPGYKLVPVEPTQAMLEAAHDAIQSEGLTTTTWLRTTCYRAMLDAAPEAPQPAKC